MTLAIAHRQPLDRPKYGSQQGANGTQSDEKDDYTLVLDCIREVRPPFSPEAVVQEFAAVALSYGVRTVTGDRYAGEWPRERFKHHGVTYQVAEQTRSDLYLALVPAINSQRVRLLDDTRLENQLITLERRTTRVGRDLVDHPPGGHDDVANAAAGALLGALAAASRQVVTFGIDMQGRVTFTNQSPAPRVWARRPGISAETGIQHATWEERRNEHH